MYIGIDIGGSKSLIALLDESGQIVKNQKYQTQTDFSDFINSLIQHLRADFISDDVKGIGLAAPGQIDYSDGEGIIFGNLPWQNVPIGKSLADAFNLPIVVENDANAAGLAEARSLNPPVNNVVYVTISTGIGTGVIVNGKLDPNRRRSEGGDILFPFAGAVVPWEKFASGKALYDKYGTYARDLEDDQSWREVVENLVLGFSAINALLCPEVIIIGGSIGTYLSKYERFLNERLEQTKPKTVTLPRIIQAYHPEEAVVYGCYHLIKDSLDGN